MGAETAGERVVRIVTKMGVARNRDFESQGLHPQNLADACRAGLIEKVGRGMYSLPRRSEAPRQRLVEACKRVPQGVVCLLSALWYHGLIAEEPETIWMMIDTKAREPQIDSLPIKIITASGDALTQGFVPIGLISETQLRVTSPMKTVADCFKYADRIGTEVGPAALISSVAANKYNRQRLLRFAEICRVRQAIAAAEKARRKEAHVFHPPEDPEALSRPVRVWDRETLAREVWECPVRQLATKYGVSDNGVRKHCKKMGIALPGRGYWAKKSSQKKLPKEYALRNLPTR
jgi:predicted transcriptional regulator of viral defense system